MITGVAPRRNGIPTAPRVRAAGAVPRAILTVALGAALIVLGAAAPRAATAQPAELQRARALFEETAFEDALEVLDAVSDDAGFARADVVEWLVLRARLASAQGDDPLTDRELTRVARLTNEVALPPDLRARFDALAPTVPTLAVTLRWEDGVLEAIPAIDDPLLVREVRVTARELRAPPDAATRTGSGRLAVAEPAECRAEVIGPGGAVLASAAGCPASAVATAADPLAEPSSAGDPGGGGDDVWIAVGVVAGVLALAGGAVALGVVLGTAPQDVEVRSVVVRW